MNRREFLQTSLATGAGLGLSRLGYGADIPATGPATAPTTGPSTVTPGKADACIFIWLPGGIPQTDSWDPKQHTPFTAGMKGSQLLGTCPNVPTAADGIRFGNGLETMGSVMNKGAVIRSLTNETKFGAVHLK